MCEKIHKLVQSGKQNEEDIFILKKIPQGRRRKIQIVGEDQQFSGNKFKGFAKEEVILNNVHFLICYPSIALSFTIPRTFFKLLSLLVFISGSAGAFVPVFTVPLNTNEKQDS